MTTKNKKNSQNGYFFWLGALFLISAALLFRFINLETKTLHHDESIHTYFSWILFKEGRYEYHPLSHGPMLYYLIALSYKLYQISDAASRIAPALFGTALVGFLIFFRSFWRNQTTLAVLALAAFSPMLIYVSRFARHDMICLFFTLVIIWATLSYLKKPKPLYIYLTVFSFALSYVNHELTYLTGLIWLIATGLALIWVPRRNELLHTFFSRDIWHLLLSSVIGLFIIVLFYSSFGRFPDGLLRALPNPKNPDSALGYWIDQHSVRRGGQPVYFYLLMLPLYELLPFILGFFGAAWGLFSKNLAWRFFSLWAILTLAVYSIAGEKMPWLTVHPLLPLLLVCGSLIEHLRLVAGKKITRSLMTILIIYLAWSGYNAYRLAYLNPTNPIELAVYVQTQPIVKETAARFLNDPTKPSLTVGLDVAWPFVWYLRDYRYSYSSTIDDPPSQFVLFSLEEAAKNNMDDYEYLGRYPFRSWWVPDKGLPPIGDLMNYYFRRVPWNSLGSYDFEVYQLKNLD